jgi:hypothetical protein
MTGRYLIYTPLESRPRDWRKPDRRLETNWHKFVALCQSLKRDGLTYDVQLNLAGENPHVLITACGTAKPRRQAATRHAILPSPVPAQRSRERALEVAWFLPENAERRNTYTAYWLRRQDRYQELAGMAEENLRAELEYWRELEALSGQREHFKPGRTDETAYADDEVRTDGEAA